MGSQKQGFIALCATITLLFPGDADAQVIARKFPLSIERRSLSRLTYLVRNPSEGPPPGVGRVLLIRREEIPILVLRVLKHYPETNAFAARRVFRYGNHSVLSEAENYDVLEKTGDAKTLAPPLTPSEEADLSELEESAGLSQEPPVEVAPSETGVEPAVEPTPSDPLLDVDTNAAPANPEPAALEQPGPPTKDGAADAKEAAPDNGGGLPQTSEYDPELDSGSSPPPGEDDEESEDTVSSQLGAAVEEVIPLEPYRHWVSAQAGFFTAGPVSARGMFTGGGFRYGYSVVKSLLLRKAKIQDSITPEIGVYFYKSLITLPNSALPSAYTIMPIHLSARYNIVLGKTLTFFVYGGVMFNLTLRSVNPSDELTSNFRAVIPAIGAGTIFNIGPNWAVRIDAGYDFIGAGLMLKF